MTVDVHRCRADEIDDVARFLDRHWRAGHVLARHRALLDWQHRAPDGGYGLVVARRPGDPELLGVLGVIPTSRHDPALAARDVLWLTTWKVRPDAGVAGLGLLLHRRLLELFPWHGAGTVGNNEAAAKIYRALRYRTGELERHYLLDPGRERFHLAVVPGTERAAPDGTASETAAGVLLRPLEGRELDSLVLPLGARAGGLPLKSPRYFRDRYLDHPWYDYRVLGVVRGGRIAALAAIRIAEHEGHRAVRLVDLLGAHDALDGAGDAFRKLLARDGAEYVDVFHHGLPPGTFERAGFRRLDPDGAVVIPGYFEPFERSNVRLRFAVDSRDGSPFVLFKGDADQDRPNLLEDPS